MKCRLHNQLDDIGKRKLHRRVTPLKAWEKSEELVRSIGFGFLETSIYMREPSERE